MDLVLFVASIVIWQVSLNFGLYTTCACVCVPARVRVYNISISNRGT